jgi:tetratricopeptide (TPR) repeat protein
LTAGAPSGQRWLYGPLPDLLLGCGVLYLVLFAALALYGPEIRSLQPAYLLPLLVILVSMPHYGGTLLRVYDSREDRTQYVLFTVYATIAIFVLFVWAVYSPIVGSVLFTVYLTWSPWHYTGQNYGIAVMFLRRRGVEFSDGTKRLLYASFVLSFAIVTLVFHTAEGRAVAYNLKAGEESVVFLPVGIPAALTDLLLPVLGLAWLVVTVLVVARFRSTALSTLAPAGLLLLSQTVWFTLPFGLDGMGWKSGIEALDAQTTIRAYVLWVALAHAVQYLWVTSFYAKSAPRWNGQSAYFAKVAAAGIGIWTIPAVLFAPGLLGSAPYDAGLALLIASAVNIHHFILDGAIWKLRNLRIGNVLIRSRPPELGAAVAGKAAWLRPAIWAVCGASAMTALYVFVQLDLRYARALGRGDWQTAVRALDQVAWAGRDSARRRAEVAQVTTRAGELQASIRLYERSVALDPVADRFGQLALLRQYEGDLDAAAAAFRNGLELEPHSPALLLKLGELELERGNAGAALPLLEHLLEMYPDHEGTRAALERARLAAADAG